METIDPIQVLLAFGLVLGLIGLLALVLRFIARLQPGFGIGIKPGGRLHIVETKLIDARRRLVIVRCDEAEHLLLLSAQGDVLIAANLPARGDA